MTNLRFRRGERLKSKKTIESLFSEANAISQFPLLLLWKKFEDSKSPNPVKTAIKFPVQFSSSVSKKKLKNAVDRNYVKRRIREAYRLNKNDLYENLQDDSAPLAFMIIFTGRALEDCDKIGKSMKKLIAKFLEQYKNEN
jgi:ribonuclease P protein component